MYVGRQFSLISPDDTIDVGFDYVNDLALSELLSSATFTLEVKDTDDGITADASPNSRKSGSASIAAAVDTGLNTVALQRLTGMQAGNLYRIICNATTSAGQILELYSYAWCRDPS